MKPWQLVLIAQSFMNKQLEAKTGSAPKGVYMQTMHKLLVLN